MSRGPDAATLLERALGGSAARAGCPVGIAESGMTRWASATFVGARHVLVLTAARTEAFERWLEALPEAEFSLRGHLVADLCVEAVRRDGDCTTAEIQVLTVEDR